MANLSNDVNSRAVKFNKDGKIMRWGREATGGGDFGLVPDVTLHAQGRLRVAGRGNKRVRILDQDGKSLGKWSNHGPRFRCGGVKLNLR